MGWEIFVLLERHYDRYDRQDSTDIKRSVSQEGFIIEMHEWIFMKPQIRSLFRCLDLCDTSEKVVNSLPLLRVKSHAGHSTVSHIHSHTHTHSNLSLSLRLRIRIRPGRALSPRGRIKSNKVNGRLMARKFHLFCMLNEKK